MEEISFVINLLGLALIVSASLVKGEKINGVLILLLVGNALLSVVYLLAEDGINGAVSGLIACVQILINYLFRRKEKRIPTWLVGIYIVSFVAVNLAVGGISFDCLLAILACVAFVASILQKNGRNYRICGIANTALWSAYDILTCSYVPLITNGTLLMMNIGGFLIHDLKKRP